MRILRPVVEFARRLRGAAKRAIDSLPWIQGGPRAADYAAERAMSLIPFFACVRLLAEQVSSLPLQAFRRDGDTRVRITDPPLLRKPAARGTSVRWLRQLVISLAMRGNAYGLVTARDGFGLVTGMEWLHPDEVHVDDTSPTMPVYYWKGQTIPVDAVVHIAWMVQPGKVKGLSPVSAFAASIGVGLQATDYGATWFENGGTPPGTFRNTQKTITQDQADAISERLVAAVRRRRPIVYGADWDFTALKVTPEESQFIETMRLNATQIAAIFGVPPEMVGGESGGSLTYNTTEMNGQALLKFVLRPWLMLIESELTALLPERQYVQFNADAVVRADLRTRYEAHRIGLEAGFLSVNEVRALEDLPPTAGGELPAPRVPVEPATVARALSVVESGHVNGHHTREPSNV